LHNCPGNSPALPLFAVLVDQVGQFRFCGKRIHQFGGGFPGIPGSSAYPAGHLSEKKTRDPAWSNCIDDTPRSSSMPVGSGNLISPAQPI
jgi:hypothetical protein